MIPEAEPSNMKVTSKRATSIGAKVHEMQFILASASLECLLDTASDSRALPQTKGGKRQSGQSFTTTGPTAKCCPKLF